jgi:putative component of toxin-antitoxin plasmid stabilization module
MRAKSIIDLKDLRNALNTNDYNTINRILNRPNDERRIDQQLRKTLNVCDIDDIHWNKSEGIYEVSIDNGLNTRVYTIKYSMTQVILSYAQTGASELSMYTYEVSPEYFSESIILYIFDITENGLKFKKIDGLG